MDFDHCGKETQSARLQYPIHLGKCYSGIDTVLDLELTDGYYNLGHLDLWERYGVPHYLMQALRGLAAWPMGPFDRHRK